MSRLLFQSPIWSFSGPDLIIRTEGHLGEKSIVSRRTRNGNIEQRASKFAESRLLLICIRPSLWFSLKKGGYLWRPVFLVELSLQSQHRLPCRMSSFYFRFDSNGHINPRTKWQPALPLFRGPLSSRSHIRLLNDVGTNRVAE